MTVKIDKGIPIPVLYGKNHTKYPWHEMEVGDSFLCEASNAHSCVNQANRAYAPKKFMARSRRIWRIE